MRKPVEERAIRVGMKAESGPRRGLQGNVTTFTNNYGKKEPFKPGKPKGKRIEFGSMEDVNKANKRVGRER